MEIRPLTILYYVTQDGKAPFQQWYSGLKDIRAQVTIQSRLTRLERGLLGDCKPVGKGVYELRIFFGPGYRVYLGLHEKSWVILLCGGDKNSQDKDISFAQVYWHDYLRRFMK